MKKKIWKKMNKVKVINNALSSSMMKLVKEFSRDNNSGELMHSYMYWGNNVIKDSNPVLVKVFTEELTSKIVEDLKDHLPEYKEIRCMWYGWIRGSYIPWHSDENQKFGITIYLNDYWDDDWGGYFAYNDGGEIKCIKPEFNKLTCIEPPVQHTVFNTSSIAPIRETIQIFGK